MKSDMLQRCAKSALSALAATMFIANAAFAAPSASDAGTPTLQIEMALATRNTISLGEPVLLYYMIRNASAEEVDVYMGPDQKGWTSSRLVDPTGAAVPAEAVLAPQSRGGIQPSDGQRIEAGASREGGVLASREFVIARPGRYTLSVHVWLPYGTGPAAEAVPKRQLESAFGTVLTQDFTFTLNVTPPIPARVTIDAETLRQKILSDRNGRMTPALMEALFSFPEAQALPSWRALAASPNLSTLALSHLAGQLVRLHSLAAADIMADMIWNPAQPPAVLASSDPNRLVEMYRAGNDTLKQHIADIYSAHGLSVPATDPSQFIHD